MLPVIVFLVLAAIIAYFILNQQPKSQSNIDERTGCVRRPDRGGPGSGRDRDGGFSHPTGPPALTPKVDTMAHRSDTPMSALPGEQQGKGGDGGEQEKLDSGGHGGRSKTPSKGSSKDSKGKKKGSSKDSKGRKPGKKPKKPASSHATTMPQEESKRDSKKHPSSPVVPYTPDRYPGVPDPVVNSHSMAPASEPRGSVPAHSPPRSETAAVPPAPEAPSRQEVDGELWTDVVPKDDPEVKAPGRHHRPGGRSGKGSRKGKDGKRGGSTKDRPHAPGSKVSKGKKKASKKGRQSKRSRKDANAAAGVEEASLVAPPPLEEHKDDAIVPKEDVPQNSIQPMGDDAVIAQQVPDATQTPDEQDFAADPNNIQDSPPNDQRPDVPDRNIGEEKPKKPHKKSKVGSKKKKDSKRGRSGSRKSKRGSKRSKAEGGGPSSGSKKGSANRKSKSKKGSKRSKKQDTAPDGHAPPFNTEPRDGEVGEMAAMVAGNDPIWDPAAPPQGDPGDVFGPGDGGMEGGGPDGGMAGGQDGGMAGGQDGGMARGEA